MPAKKTTILAADDDPQLLRLITRNLQLEGYDVLAASDGQQALELIENNSLDLVLLDVMMPRMDGFTVCYRVREFSSVPIIIITARGQDQDKVRGLDLGADDYLTKPFKLAEVTLTVDRALDDRRLREENRRLREQVERRFGFDNLVGRSKAMQTVFEKVRAVAETDVGGEERDLCVGLQGAQVAEAEAIVALAQVHRGVAGGAVERGERLRLQLALAAGIVDHVAVIDHQTRGVGRQGSQVGGAARQAADLRLGAAARFQVPALLAGMDQQYRGRGRG